MALGLPCQINSSSQSGHFSFFNHFSAFLSRVSTSLSLLCCRLTRMMFVKTKLFQFFIFYFSAFIFQPAQSEAQPCSLFNHECICVCRVRWLFYQAVLIIDNEGNDDEQGNPCRTHMHIVLAWVCLHTHTPQLYRKMNVGVIG